MGKGTTIVVVRLGSARGSPGLVSARQGRGGSRRSCRDINARRTELDRFAKHRVLYQYGHEIDALHKVDPGEVENLVINRRRRRLGPRPPSNADAGSGQHHGFQEPCRHINNGVLAVWAGREYAEARSTWATTSEATEAIIGKRLMSCSWLTPI